MVNVEFMLCPTDQMIEIFSILPPQLKIFTHRTIMTFIVIAVGILISYLYIFLAFVLKTIFPGLFASRAELQKNTKPE
jgi:hypothetical protein